MLKVASTVSPAMSIMLDKAALSAYWTAGPRGSARAVEVSDYEEAPRVEVVAHLQRILELLPCP